ncbi:MAG: peptidase M23 [Firmicutes bacterium]|nr:peptidase M23 [Bacillota bacterium]
MKNIGKQMAEKALLKGAKWAGKKILILLAPYIPIIAIVLVILVLVTTLIASMFGSMPSEQSLTGVELSEQDEEILVEYEDLCDQYNVDDTWLVSGESSPDNPHYPGTGQRNFNSMRDRYNNDYKLRLQWPVLHSVLLHWAMIQNEYDIDNSTREEFARELHPYYYYKKSEVIRTTTDDEGDTHTTRTTVYLLVEAYTISGHYQYHYEWETERYDNTTKRYEQLKDTKQILPDRWQRLKTYIKDKYDLKDTDDMELNRMSIIEAANGFKEEQQWMDWLLQNEPVSDFATTSMIPPDLFFLFKDAEDEYDLPWWFLAAIAFNESGFNATKENIGENRYGLFQMKVTGWEQYATLLDFDITKDKDNPRAQIMSTAYMLANSGLSSIDWEDEERWQEDTLPALAELGGYNELEECRDVYAESIWQYAERFSGTNANWPVPGHTEISSPYGYRTIFGIEGEFHSGIDIPAPSNAQVISVSGGKVISVGYDSRSGKYVVIRDAVNQYSYCHLNRQLVRSGDTVQPGEIVGLVGSTGRSSGPHLHLTVKQNGETIDPLLILDS